MHCYFEANLPGPEYAAIARDERLEATWMHIYTQLCVPVMEESGENQTEYMRAIKAVEMLRVAFLRFQQDTRPVGASQRPRIF